MPRWLKAATSRPLLRVPVVVSILRFGSREMREGRNGDRSRIVQMMSTGEHRIGGLGQLFGEGERRRKGPGDRRSSQGSNLSTSLSSSWMVSLKTSI